MGCAAQNFVSAPCESFRFAIFPNRCVRKCCNVPESVHRCRENNKHRIYKYTHTNGINAWDLPDALLLVPWNHHCVDIIVDFALSLLSTLHIIDELHVAIITVLWERVYFLNNSASFENRCACVCEYQPEFCVCMASEGRIECNSCGSVLQKQQYCIWLYTFTLFTINFPVSVLTLMLGIVYSNIWGWYWNQIAFNRLANIFSLSLSRLVDLSLIGD